MHRAPVVGIVVLDGHGAPLPEPLEVAHDLARSPDMHGSHHLLVISEEQFKVRITHRSLFPHDRLNLPVSFDADLFNVNNVVVGLGFHPSQGELQDEAEADGCGRLQSTEGRCGLVWQQSHGGLWREWPDGSDQSGRRARGVTSYSQDAGPVQLHPPRGRQRHCFLCLHQARPG